MSNTDPCIYLVLDKPNILDQHGMHYLLQKFQTFHASWKTSALSGELSCWHYSCASFGTSRVRMHRTVGLRVQFLRSPHDEKLLIDYGCAACDWFKAIGFFLKTGYDIELYEQKS
jgi:hypothetical protein